MILSIENKYYKDNYKCLITCNGKELPLNYKKDCIFVELEDNLEKTITIKFVNFLFEDKKGIFLMIFYWFVVLLSGTSDNQMFGKPYNAILSFKTKSAENINIKVNKFKADKPFELLNCNCEVLQNCYEAKKGYKIKWFIFTALPLIILSTFTFFVLYRAIFLKNILFLRIIYLMFVITIYLLLGKWIYNIVNKDNINNL
ncbi:hypothetical protein [Fonticella tunisiensis]|nr:hypothetical protein [Fonticella tunisiensis]